MARGDSGMLPLAPLRRDGKPSKALLRDEIRRAAHDEALALLGLKEDLLDTKTLEERFDLLGAHIFSLDPELPLEDELGDLFPVERRILASDPTGLYRMFLEENLLLKELGEGLLAKNYLEDLKKDLPGGDWSDEEILVLSFLRACKDA